MAAFAFKAIDKNGKNKSGVLEGDNARQIRQQLREQQLIPLEVEQVAEKERKSANQFSLFKAKKYDDGGAQQSRRRLQFSRRYG